MTVELLPPAVSHHDLVELFREGGGPGQTVSCPKDSERCIARQALGERGSRTTSQLLIAPGTATDACVTDGLCKGGRARWGT